MEQTGQVMSVMVTDPSVLLRLLKTGLDQDYMKFPLKSLNGRDILSSCRRW